MKRGKGKKDRVRSKDAPIIVERGGGAVEVRFQNPDMARIAAIMMDAARFMPSMARESLKRQDLMDDFANTIYLAAIEFRRTRTSIRFTGDKEKDHETYKAATRHAWRILYAMLRDNVPEYKRKYYTKFMSPDKMRNVEVPMVGRVAFSKESELMKVEVDLH